MPNLYQIGEEYAALDEMFSESQGEVNEELDERVKKVDEILEHKTDAYVTYMHKIEDDIEIATKRIRELNEFVQVRKNRVQLLKENIIAFYEQTGKGRLQGDLYQILVSPGNETLAITLPEEIPVEYVKTKTETQIDKRRLLNDLKSGEIATNAASIIRGKPKVKLSTKPATSNPRRKK